MNLSLSKEVLNKPLGKQSKAAQYPTKHTINLVPPVERLVWTPRLIIATVIGAILILLFAKFAVIDVMGLAASSNAKLSAARGELSALQQQNAQYPQLQREVAQYGAGGLSTEERSLVNREAVLGLVTVTVGSRTDVKSVTLKDATLEIQFMNAALADVSAVVSSIETSPLVAHVALDSSKHNANSEVISTVTVTLKGGTDVATGASGSSANAQGAKATTTQASTTTEVRNG